MQTKTQRKQLKWKHENEKRKSKMKLFSFVEIKRREGSSAKTRNGRMQLP